MRSPRKGFSSLVAALIAREQEPKPTAPLSLVCILFGIFGLNDINSDRQLHLWGSLILWQGSSGFLVWLLGCSSMHTHALGPARACFPIF